MIYSPHIKNTCQEVVMRYRLLMFLGLILTLSGCTPIISEQSRKLINSDVSFKTVKETPENYTGKNILLGGRIANVRNSAEGAQIEIVQFDLTSQGYPEETFISYGRFMAINNSYMDPLIFRRGMLITLTGELKGKKTMRLDDMDYTYPVISLREWHLWPGSEPDRGCTYPTPLPEYNPYNFGFGYEPFLQRPFTPLYVPR
jgi:outer membrane lipoprotein